MYDMALVITGIILLALSVVLAFVPVRWSAPVAWCGLLLSGWGTAVEIGTGTYVFWAVAAAIVLVISYLLPSEIARSGKGNGYICGATLAGALVGLVISHAALIIGAVLGAFCGALAYSRTPAGAALGFPSPKFLNYLCAKGLPAVVTMCIVGLAVGALTAIYGPQ